MILENIGWYNYVHELAPQWVIALKPEILWQYHIFNIIMYIEWQTKYFTQKTPVTPAVTKISSCAIKNALHLDKNGKYLVYWNDNIICLM